MHDVELMSADRQRYVMGHVLISWPRSWGVFCLPYCLDAKFVESSRVEEAHSRQ